MKDQKTILYSKGVQNKVPAEEIAQDAASDSLSWVTIDGQIELSRGRVEIGEDNTAATGGIFGEIFAPTTTGVALHYRKKNTKIQYLDILTDTWTDVITGLTNESIYFFAPYASLAGNFLYIGGVDGLYKINLANPDSYKDMYDPAINHKGYILINESRMFMWNVSAPNIDRTAVYLSKIDPQDSNYTSVTNEVIGMNGSTNYTGTLAEATGDRFIFALSIKGTTGAGLETFTDNGDGTLTSDKGGTGTINYATGAYNVTFDAVTTSGNVKADYQYEDSNSGGITDFTFSSPRVAGEGDFFPQEYLGEPIQNVIPFDNKYYSFKTTSVYQLDLTADDTNASNTLYRADIGIPSPRAVVSTGKGMAYIDTANPSVPILSMLVRNPVGGNLEPINLTPLFKWENYEFDTCVMETWGENIVVSAQTSAGSANNRLFLINTSQKYSVDIFYYGANTLTKNLGLLYAGSPLSEVVYQLFSGFDDLDSEIDNYWEGKADNFGDDIQKRYRWIQLKGLIDPNQNYEVYADFDDTSFQLLGTVRGNQSYVDLNAPQLIGSNTVGGEPIGGGESVTVFPYLCQIRIKTPKFRIRKLKFKALNYGYVSIQWQKDVDILTFREKLPGKYLLKQYVSLNGEDTDLPQFQN